MQTHFIPSTRNQVHEYLYQTPISGLLYIDTKSFSDERGFYAELARLPEIETQLGITFSPRQINLSHSKKHVCRGLHAENWNKLLTITHGQAFCAWADIRPDSATFGDIVTMTVGLEDQAHFGSIFVSAGIANSFCVLSETLDYVYTVDKLYAQRDTSHDVAISLFDQDLNIPWPIDQASMTISQRDLEAITLREKYPERF